jgi:Second Messenger Oligonucleotide or Dinucleotide Synthetase domain
MTVNSYLTSRASAAVLSNSELTSINTSIVTLQTRLNLYFPNSVSSHFRFGSSTRGTILPRKMDINSDIDYMVVFSEGGYTPQTYLNKLKKFVEYYYSSSEIKQSSPCIVLELNHIKFELVPALAYAYPYSGYQIPNGVDAWQHTNPTDFNTSLTNKNVEHNSLIKPSIRLLKYWNAYNGPIFNSYDLEQHVVNSFYFTSSNIKDYLFSTIENLGINTEAQWRKDALNRAKNIVAEVKRLENDGCPALAEIEVRKLIPE